MTRYLTGGLIAVAILAPIALIYAGVNVYDHIDDAYAQWGAADMVIDYMRDHGGAWPPNWDALEPYFPATTGAWPVGLTRNLNRPFILTSTRIPGNCVTLQWIPIPSRSM